MRGWEAHSLWVGSASVCCSLWARFSNESHNTQPLSIQISAIHKAPFAQALLRSQRRQASAHNGAQQEAEKRGPFTLASILLLSCKVNVVCLHSVCGIPCPKQQQKETQQSFCNASHPCRSPDPAPLSPLSLSRLPLNQISHILN